MEKKIEDYLHLYLGCWLEGGVVKLTPERLQQILDGERDNKPILRPLSSMIEEEMKWLWRFMFNRDFKGRVIFRDDKTTTSEPRWIMMSGVERLGIEMNGTVWADSDLSNWKHNQHEITRYLISKSFDIFNLIPEGLAIDATTLKSENP